MKPGRVPFDIPNIIASDTWDLDDFQFGWFWKLIFRMYDSENLGYLPNDPMELWQLAGAKSEWFFRKNGGPSLLDREFKRTADGCWIYHEKVLDVLKEEHNRELGRERVKRYRDGVTVTHRERGLRLSLINSDQLQEHFENAYKSYPRHIGKRAAERAFYTATTRIAKSQSRDLGEVARFIGQRAEQYKNTPAGKRGKFTPHMSTWLNQDRFLDDPKEWEHGEIQKAVTSREQESNEAIDRAAASVFGWPSETPAGSLPDAEDGRDDG